MPNYCYRMFVLLLGVFLDEAVAVGVEELAQLVNLLLQLFAYVGVAHAHTVGVQLHNLCGGDNVAAVAHRLLG